MISAYPDVIAMAYFLLQQKIIDSFKSYNYATDNNTGVGCGGGWGYSLLLFLTLSVWQPFIIILYRSS